MTPYTRKPRLLYDDGVASSQHPATTGSSVSSAHRRGSFVSVGNEGGGSFTPDAAAARGPSAPRTPSALFSADGAALDPYEVLQLPRTATRREVKRAYKQLSRRFHPDRVGPGEVVDLAAMGMDASTAFARINDAYSVLVDTYSRMRYHAMENVDDETTLNRLAEVKRRYAKRDVELMHEALAHSVGSEKQRHGLIIRVALYGEMSVIPEPTEPLREQGLSGRLGGVVIDVTRPLQYLVEESQLRIAGGSSKVLLKGFFDPVNGFDKRLAVRYLFRGMLHQVVVDDFSELKLPLRSHLIPDAPAELFLEPSEIDVYAQSPRKRRRTLRRMASPSFSPGSTSTLHGSSVAEDDDHATGGGDATHVGGDDHDAHSVADAATASVGRGSTGGGTNRGSTESGSTDRKTANANAWRRQRAMKKRRASVANRRKSLGLMSPEPTPASSPPAEGSDGVQRTLYALHSGVLTGSGMRVTARWGRLVAAPGLNGMFLSLIASGKSTFFGVEFDAASASVANGSGIVRSGPFYRWQRRQADIRKRRKVVAATVSCLLTCGALVGYFVGARAAASDASGGARAVAGSSGSGGSRGSAGALARLFRRSKS